MGRWRTHTDAWLVAEQEGRDEAAEAAFDRVLGALPAIEPSPVFAARVAEAAWAARARRRRLVGLAAATAGVALVAATAVVVYAASGGRVAWLLTATATAASGAVVSLLAAGVTLAGWWSAAAGTGRSLVTAVASPYSLAALVAIELIAVGALVMLHRLLRSEVELRTPRAYCF